MSLLIQEKEGSVLFLILNRPDKRNALNAELISELKIALEEAAGEEDLSCIVIKGAGSDFCSGADLAEIRKIAENGVLENLKDAEVLLELFVLIRNTAVPVIAAVHGHALAGGCGLATACDLVIASESARFGYPEVKIGFVPAMVMAILRRNLGEKLSFELVTQGFDFSAEEAFEMGLVNLTIPDVEFEDGVRSYAQKYDSISRSAVALSKKLLYQMDSMGFEDALRVGAEVNAIARMTEDCRKGIERFLRK